MRGARAVEDFLAQTYEPRSLVVVYDGPDQSGRLVQALGRVTAHDVSIVERARGALTLGALRNLSVDTAKGDVICQWDDDDRYHPERLAIQVQGLLDGAAEACFLTEQLQLVEDEGTVFVCDWAAPRDRPSWPSAIPNTLMCYRDIAPRYPEVGANSTRSEDYAAMQVLFARASVVGVSGCAWAYVYVTHRCNTWSRAHHDMIIAVTAADADDVAARAADVEREWRRYGFESSAMLCGRGGEPQRTLFGTERGRQA